MITISVDRVMVSDKKLITTMTFLSTFTFYVTLYLYIIYILYRTFILFVQSRFIQRIYHDLDKSFIRGKFIYLPAGTAVAVL